METREEELKNRIVENQARLAEIDEAIVRSGEKMVEALGKCLASVEEETGKLDPMVAKLFQAYYSVTESRAKLLIGKIDSSLETRNSELDGRLQQFKGKLEASLRASKG